MKRFLLALTIVLTAGVAHAQRVIDLPETSQNWYLTAVYSSLDNPTARDQQLWSILRNDSALANLISQVTFTEWDDNSQFVRQSAWKAYLGTNRPALLLQTPATQNGTGSVVYFASGPHLKTDQNLASSLAAAVHRYSQGRDCPRCPLKPEPQPQPQPAQPQIPVIVPPSNPPSVEPQPAKEETPLLLVLGLPILGAGFGLFQSLRKEASV